jgi:predicted MPP superfamily phosphohydrolase
MEDVDLNKYVVVLDHEPNDYDNEEDAKMDLVISGHTHGGQLFPLMIFDKMFGANDQIYGIEKRGISTFIVSSGIGDWAVKFKTGTVAEYVVIDLKNN